MIPPKYDAGVDALRLAHLIFLFTWGGLVLAEVVVEGLGASPEGQAFAARAHYWMDVLLELPLVGGVLATGALLAARAWPLSTLHWVKIGAALLAIGANLYCAVLVVRRHRLRDDVPSLARLSAQVRWTGVAIPAGVVALYIGLRYFV